MLRRGSNTFWEDTLVPTRRVEDTANCYQLTISQPSSHSPASPTSRLFKKQRKQNRTQSHHHLAASASTRVWHARYWQPQRPIFLFLCCCFKSKARAVIRKHKHADPLTRRGRRSGRERTLTAILPFPCSGCHSARLEQGGGGGVNQDMPLAPQRAATTSANGEGLPLMHGHRKTPPTGARCSGQRSQLGRCGRLGFLSP